MNLIEEETTLIMTSTLIGILMMTDDRLLTITMNVRIATTVTRYNSYGDEDCNLL